MNEESKNEDFLFGKAEVEMDEPIDNEAGFPESMDADSLEARQLEIKEKDKDRNDKKYFTAFRLIVGCLVFLGLVFLIDTIVTIISGKSSETTNSIIEIIKTLLFTLSGYLFARKDNQD